MQQQQGRTRKGHHHNGDGGGGRWWWCLWRWWRLQVSRSAVREARFLAECCHCNITALKEAYQSSSGRIYLVLEYAQHVLSHQLKSHKKGLPAVAVRSIIFQLLQALQYLHSRGIMHRGAPRHLLGRGAGEGRWAGRHGAGLRLHTSRRHASCRNRSLRATATSMPMGG